MVINNKKNNQISNQDEDPTIELEPLSEEVCAQLMISDGTPTESDSLAEIEEVEAGGDDAEAPSSEDSASVIQELRRELKFRVEMNSILQLGIDQLRKRCDGQAEQVSSLEKTCEKLRCELERSNRQVKKTKQKLAKAKESEQALLINLKRLGKASTDTAVVADQAGAIAELRKGKSDLTNTVSGLEARLESVTKDADYLEARMSEASAENAKLSAELESKTAQIDGYKNEIAALRRRSTAAELTSSDRGHGTQPGQRSQAEACWALVGMDGFDSDAHIVSDGVLTIGSSPDCDIRIQSNFVSRHHAQLVQTRNGCLLRDLESTNGTFINSRRVNKRILRAGDLVTIGKERYRYERTSMKSKTGSTASDYSFDSSGS